MPISNITETPGFTKVSDSVIQQDKFEELVQTPAESVLPVSEVEAPPSAPVSEQVTQEVAPVEATSAVDAASELKPDTSSIDIPDFSGLVAAAIGKDDEKEAKDEVDQGPMTTQKEQKIASTPAIPTVERQSLPELSGYESMVVKASLPKQDVDTKGLPNVAPLTSYIEEAAAARGIDPSIAVRVARSEGLAKGVWQSNYRKNGKREPSYGPFQLLVGGGDTGFPEGMGNAFKKATGLDPADPKNVRATIDFALDHAKKNGWGAWYGAKKLGITGKTGIS